MEKTKKISLLLFDLQKLHSELSNSMGSVIEDAKFLLAILCKLELEFESIDVSSHLPADNQSESQCYNSEEAAKYLMIKKSTLWKLYQLGKLQGCKPNGKLLVFTKAQLDSYLSGNANSLDSQIEEKAMIHVTRSKSNKKKK